MKNYLSKHLKITAFFVLLMLTACNAQQKDDIIIGANRMTEYLPLVKDKNVGIVSNQTSLVKTDEDGYIHLVDTLLKRDMKVKKVFAPEHGFRGKADAGEVIEDGIDRKTGLPIISLYGKNKMPKRTQLEDIDIMLFDIQDVGVRFYTYISTLHYIMKACAKFEIPLIVLDRPNPNADLVGGPVLKEGFESFVGMHAIPVAHGLTIAEYARMIMGEGWLGKNLRTELHPIYMENYNKSMRYEPPVPPSPNLPNYRSIRYYPSLCFFEGTKISVGRGTDIPFQVFGAPFLPQKKYTFNFTPQPNEGAQYPKHQGEKCYGEKFSELPASKVNIAHLVQVYKDSPEKAGFFNDFFNKLAGNSSLKKKIKDGWSAKAIHASWKNDLKKYRLKRSKYVHYPSD